MHATRSMVAMVVQQQMKIACTMYLVPASPRRVLPSLVQHTAHNVEPMVVMPHFPLTACDGRVKDKKIFSPEVLGGLGPWGPVVQ